MLSSIPFEIPSYLLDRANTKRLSRMAIAGADHKIALESAHKCALANLIEPVLIGDKRKIELLAESVAWDISKFQLINAIREDDIAQVAVSLARAGEVATLMKGHLHTDILMRAILNDKYGLRTNSRLSHIFHMTVPNNPRVLLITDGALNVAPNVSTKIEIVKNAVQLAHALGNNRPRVAMLSGTETAIKSMPSSTEALEVVERAKRGEINNALVDGPFAFDIAISQKAAELKGIDSPVAGFADVIVVPNIEMGNGLFKMMVYFMSGLAAGVIIGAKVPIVLTSRADPPEARLAATAIANIISKHNSL